MKPPAGCNRHHLVPKSRNGHGRPSNILIIEIPRHIAWHILFDNMTLEEVISFLTALNRLRGKKRRRLSDSRVKRFITDKKIKASWLILFGDRTLEEVIALLTRLLRLKRRVCKRRRSAG